MSDKVKEAAERLIFACEQLESKLDYPDAMSFSGGTDREIIKRCIANLRQALASSHRPDDDELITEEWIRSLSPHNRTLTIEYWIRDGRVTIGSVCGCDIVPSIIFTTRGQLRRLVELLGGAK